MKNIKIKYYTRNKELVNPNLGDAGLDIYAFNHTVLKVKERAVIGTELYIEIPEGYYADLRPRSSLSKKGIDVKLGTIDNGYRGEIKLIVSNDSDNDVLIKHGQKLGQLVFHELIVPVVERVEKPSDLEDSDRGSKGFGSTGNF